MKIRNYDKGVSLSTLVRVLLVSFGILLLLTLFSGLNVYRRYNELTRITDKFVHSQSDIMELEQASDYLTDQVRTFLVTGDPVYMQNYSKETTVDRRRNLAIENMKSIIGNDETSLLMIENAMAASENLCTLELHAMRLKVMELEIDRELITDEVWKYELSDLEKSLSKEECRKNAEILIFGNEYSQKKSSVWENLELATKALEKSIDAQKKESFRVFRRSFFALMFFMLSTLVLILVFILLMHFYILRPTNKIIKSVKDNTFMPVQGPKEFKYLEKTYNDMFEYNETSKLELEYQAMHDSLTGLFNRNAFDKMCLILHKRIEPMALLIVDVDHFKIVNDKWGHAVGDQVLQRVADLLRRFFRNEDRIVRYGGDEFVLVLSGMDMSHKDTVFMKIKEINIVLKTGEDGLPPLSISVGGAFSSKGYSEQLFKNADEALYCTKSKGRCGCTFSDTVL